MLNLFILCELEAGMKMNEQMNVKPCWNHSERVTINDTVVQFHDVLYNK